MKNLTSDYDYSLPEDESYCWIVVDTRGIKIARTPTGLQIKITNADGAPYSGTTLIDLNLIYPELSHAHS